MTVHSYYLTQSSHGTSGTKSKIPWIHEEFMTTYIIKDGDRGKNILPYCCCHLLRQVATVELRHPVSCNCIQDGC